VMFRTISQEIYNSINEIFVRIFVISQTFQSISTDQIQKISKMITLICLSASMYIDEIHEMMVLHAGSPPFLFSAL
jgi:hypothetical protein